MTIPSQALAILTFGLARQLFSGTTLKWDSVQAWLAANSNPNDLGRGYAGGSLARRGGQAYADIRREADNGKIKVTASITFDPHQGAALSYSWKADKLDGKLEKRFGDNFRFRINL